MSVQRSTNPFLTPQSMVKAYHYGKEAAHHATEGYKLAREHYRGKATGPFGHPLPSKKRKRTEHHTKEQKSMEILRNNIMEIDDKIVLAKPHKGKTLGYWKLGNTWTGSVACNGGRQNWYTMLTINTISQCINSTGINANQYQSECSYFDGNPNEIQTGSALFGGVQRAKDDQAILKRASVKMIMTNANITAVHLDIYVFVCKKICSVDPGTLWDQGYIDQAGNQATGVLPNISAGIAQVAGYPSNQALFQKPTDSKSLKEYFKIVHKKSLKFQANDTYEWFLDIKFEKLLKKEKIQNAALINLGNTGGTAVYVPGSIVIMGMCRGAMVIRDTFPGSTSAWSTPLAEVGYISRTDVTLHGVPNSQSRASIVRLNQTIDSGAPVANQKQFFDGNTPVAPPVNL